jgi:hypothetical protein
MEKTTPLTEARSGRGARAQFSSEKAVGCVVLFLLPFAAAGTFCAVQAIRMASAGVWHDAAFLGIGALAFGGVGFGGLVGMRVGYQRMKETESLQAAHPEEPWLWRRDWASGRIEDSTRDTLLAAWIFAALWNVVSLPAAYVGVRNALYGGNRAALVALLFPLAGMWLLARAVQATIRKQKYGVSRLELSTRPGVVGHALAGTVRAPVGLEPPEGFQVSLTCIRRRTSGSGKGRSSSDSILWQEERRTPGKQSRDYAGMNTSIPIAFRLPTDVEPCDATNVDDRVLWRLQVSAGVPGVDYESVFEVPVFRTSASAELPSSDETSSAGGLPAPAAYQRPADSPISVTTNRRGTEILFPAARNPGAAMSLTAFMAIWFGALGVQLYVKAPIIFPIVTGLFGILIVFGVLDLWLRVSRVTVDGAGIVVASGYLEPGNERRLSAAEISDVVTSIGMQAGNTVYYDVVIRCKNGKKTTAGRSVRDKREAEWLAATIKQALGI